MRYTVVKIRVSDGAEFCTWSARVGFAPLGKSLGLFGNAFGLEYFTATFFGDRKEFQFEANATFPGTIVVNP